MAVNFYSRSNLGQTGSLGREYDVQYRRYQQNQYVFGESSFYGNMVCMGINEEKVLNKFEQDMDYDKGSLSWGRSIASNDNYNEVLFKDTSGNFAEVNFDKNQYTIKDERTLTEEMGFDWTNGKPYTVMTMDQGGMNFYEFTMTGVKDGVQDGYAIERQRAGNIKWGLTSLYHQEVNPYYLYANDNSYECMKGQWVRNILYQNLNTFMSDNEISMLSSMNETNANMSMAMLAYERLFS